MSNYIEKQKERLKLKIDLYFKEGKFGYSELCSFIDYISQEFNFFDIGLEKEDKVSPELKLYLDLMKEQLEFGYTQILTVFDTLEIYPSIKDQPVVDFYLTLELFKESMLNITYQDIILWTQNNLRNLKDKLYYDKLCYLHGMLHQKRSKGIIILNSNYIFNNKTVIYNAGEDIIIKILHKKIILPIYEDILNNLDERHFLEQLLDRYQYRTEHFTKFELQEKMKAYSSEIETKVCQPDLGQYLSDQGILFYQEIKTSNNGRIDFISNDNPQNIPNLDFIIETK